MKFDLLVFGTPFQDFAKEIINKLRDILYINEFSPIENCRVKASSLYLILLFADFFIKCLDE
jgi:hypothetical protein